MPHPPHDRHHNLSGSSPMRQRSVLAWSAWRRVLTVLPVLLALWLAVWWANAGTSAW